MCKDKRRTRKWFQVCGILNVPLEGTKYGFIRSIAFTGENVKKSGDEVTGEVEQKLRETYEKHRSQVEQEELDRLLMEGIAQEMDESQTYRKKPTVYKPF